MDAAGRIVIPKAVRERAGLSGRAELEIDVHDGRIEIEPVLPNVRFERVGYLLVAHIEGAEPGPAPFDLHAHREEMERERFGI